ncbi:hypothetical protein ACFY0G_23945 [Streptomyces sp. NPDC001552]|uniref:hypothetical protein n=1 Tax=Streptomyces sp. NPDC001552 TaxID=3364587 RepID=UPI0036CACA72
MVPDLLGWSEDEGKERLLEWASAEGTGERALRLHDPSLEERSALPGRTAPVYVSPGEGVTAATAAGMDVIDVRQRPWR